LCGEVTAVDCIFALEYYFHSLNSMFLFIWALVRIRSSLCLQTGVFRLDDLITEAFTTNVVVSNALCHIYIVCCTSLNSLNNTPMPCNGPMDVSQTGQALMLVASSSCVTNVGAALYGLKRTSPIFSACSDCGIYFGASKESVAH
jgi:hypothetical protein